MRKLLLIISVFIICVSCAPATFAEQAYSDEKCSKWAYYYIKDAESPLYDIMPAAYATRYENITEKERIAFVFGNFNMRLLRKSYDTKDRYT